MRKILSSLQFWISISILLFGVLIVLSMKIYFGEPMRWVDTENQLNLSSQQKELLNELFEKSKEKHYLIKQQIRNGEDELHKHVSSKSSEDKELIQLFENLDQLKSKMARVQFEMTLKIRDIIGAEKMKLFARVNRKIGPASDYHQMQHPPTRDHRKEDEK